MPAPLLVLALLATAASAASCRGAAVPVSPVEQAQPAAASGFGPFAATTPALSLAGAAHFVCVERRAPHIFPVHFGPERRSALTSGELEEAVIRSASCVRYTVRLDIPLAVDDAAGPGHSLRLTALMLESLRVRREHGALWNLAAWMRLSAKEPFVYGRQTWINENENVQLRLDPMEGDARLMLRYELGL